MNKQLHLKPQQYINVECWFIVRRSLWFYPPNYFVNTASFFPISHIIVYIRFNELTLGIFSFASFSSFILRFLFHLIRNWNKLHCIYNICIIIIINACVCIHFIISTLFLFILVSLIHVIDPLEKLVARSVKTEHRHQKAIRTVFKLNEWIVCVSNTLSNSKLCASWCVHHCLYFILEIFWLLFMFGWQWTND